MNSLGETLKSITPLAVPDDMFCPGCRWLLPSHPKFEELFKSRWKEWQRTEVSCRCSDKQKAEQKARREYIAASNLPLRLNDDPRTFDNFDRSPGTEEALVACWDYAHKVGPPILVLLGPLGCGKTHLLEAVARKWMERGESVRYELGIDLLDRIKSTYSEDSQTTTDGVLDQYRRASLLIIDDVGAEKTTEWAEERMMALIDARYRDARHLLVASNVPTAQARASRVWSRLLDVTTGVARQVILDGNYRERR